MAALRLAVITDSHLCAPETPAGFWNDELLLPESWALWDEAMGAIAAAAPDAIVHLGDVTNFADPDIAVEALRRLAAFGKPVLVVAGNHDVEPSGDALAQAVERLAHPLVTTTATGTTLQGFAFAGVPIKAVGGRLRVDAWNVPGDLPPDVPLVLLSHYPLIDRRAAVLAQGLRFPGDLAGAAALTEILPHRPAPSVILHGHLHWQDATSQGRILQLGMPALIEWPYAVSIVTMRDDGSGPQVERRTRRVRRPAAPAGGFALEDGLWAARDGRWLPVPLSHEETPVR